jgi:Ca2+-binding EF-hand superfamily protein
MADNIRHLESGDDPDMHEENIYDVPRGGEALSEDVTSEAESLCEEERVRKLFQACDADGDGYIDR